MTRAETSILESKITWAYRPRYGARAAWAETRPADGLVLFGGEGSDEMVRIARALNREDARRQLILTCEKSEAAVANLRAMRQRIPMLVCGFTRDIPLYMELSDFFIGKPGPGSISEALAKKLPVIVQRNAWTMAHELYNTRWVEELGAGTVVKNFSREIRGAVRQLLEPGNYTRYRQCAAHNDNRAVYEIPEMLVAILATANRSRLEPGADSVSQPPRSSRWPGEGVHRDARWP